MVDADDGLVLLLQSVAVHHHAWLHIVWKSSEHLLRRVVESFAFF